VFCFGKTTYFYHVQQFKSIVMKTVNQNLKKAAAWATYGFAAITLIGCNTYKSVADEEDGIYGNTYIVEESNTVDGKNNYYQQYFSTKAAQIEEIPEENLVFTDIEAYSTQESMDEEGYVVVQEDYIEDYGSWGSNSNEVTVNVYGGWNNGFYGNGWNAGYWNGGWNAGYWGGFRPWGFNYWNNPYWGYSSYWGYNPYWGWGNAYYNPWFYYGSGWGYNGYYNPWYYNNNGYSTIANRGRSNQDRYGFRGQSDRSNMGSRAQSSLRGRSSSDLDRGRTVRSNREFDLNRGRNEAVRNNTTQQSRVRNSAVRNGRNARNFAENRSGSIVQSRVNPSARMAQQSNTRPAEQSTTRPNEGTVVRTNPSARTNPAVTVQNSASRPVASTESPSNAAKNFKIKRRSRPASTASNTRPSNSSGTQKSFKAENAAQRSFSRPSFQSVTPMSSPRNYSRPASGRGSGGRGGRG
jgi:hypothetical protein